LVFTVACFTLSSADTEHVAIVLRLALMREGMTSPASVKATRKRVRKSKMVEASTEPITPEIAVAFAWAVEAFSLNWSPVLPEPTTLLYGQHFTIGEISRLVDRFTDPLPAVVLNMLYRETDDIKGVDVSALRDDQTYRGGGRHLRHLIEARKEAHQRK
jgi:hypothetical protein